VPVAQLSSAALHYLQMPCRGEECRGDLILIHGLAASLAFWHAGIAMPLTHFCAVTAYDLRGHGRSSMPPSGYSAESMADDLAELLNYLNIGRAHLLAHSFGGSIALLFALRHPDRVASLILADVRLRAIQPEQRLGDWSHWPRLERVLTRAGIQLDPADPEGGYQLLVELARLQLDRPEQLQDLPRLFSLGGRAGVARRWLRLQEASTIKQDFLAGDCVRREDIAALPHPLLALYGEFSPALRSGRALLRLNPGCQLIIVEGGGHFFPLSNPNRLVRPALRFIRTLIA
jgi:pimeloyl-ACP methyl ester carboxylesterase